MRNSDLTHQQLLERLAYLEAKVERLENTDPNSQNVKTLIKTDEENEVGFQMLFASNPRPMWVYDLETLQFLEVNQAAQNDYGYSREEFLAMTIADIRPQQEVPRMKAGVEARRANLKYSGRWVHQRKNGDVFEVEIISHSLTFAGRRAVLVMAEDISRRLQIERGLMTEKERLSVTLQSIGDAVIATDTNERVVLMNPIAEQLTGWPQAEALGRPLSEVFQPYDIMTDQPTENPVLKALQTKTTVTMLPNSYIHSRNGAIYTVGDTAAPIIDSSTGQVLGSVIVFRDTGEKQKSEQEMLKAQKLESISLLAGGLAHDFNNFLTAVVGFLGLARAELNENEVQLQELLQEAETATFRARSLTQQLLTFTKGGTPIKRPLALGQLVEEAVRFALSGSKVKPAFQLSEKLWMVEVDEGQLIQVMHNLVINAVQAMPNGGTLTVSAHNLLANEPHPAPLKPNQNYVKLSIADEGIGIPPDLLSKIFNPYFTTKPNGSGLGLATSFSIIAKHEGCMEVESEIGTGTTFNLYLPSSEFRPQTGTNKLEAVWTVKPPTAKRTRILVIDDEAAILKLVRRVLESQGYEVETAADGLSAIAIFREAIGEGRPFQLVVLDLTLPGGLGGSQLAAQLRELDPNIRCLVISGYGNDPIVAEYREHGFQAALSKPFRTQELLEKLMEAME